MSKRSTVLGSLLVILLVVMVRPAEASVIWDGDASKGTGVFGIIGSNCASPGSVTAVDDASQGRVWRYDKPASSGRCETRGVKVGGSLYQFEGDRTYYLGWRTKLSNTVNNNATFQWKSFGNHIQNWPVVLKLIDGRLTMIQRQPDGVVHTVWSTPFAANTWYRVVLAIHVSDETLGGFVELWFNGVKQTFSDGTQRWECRTLDDENHPKWGVYGATGSDVRHYVDALKIGTSYSDVAP